MRATSHRPVVLLVFAAALVSIIGCGASGATGITPVPRIRSLAGAWSGATSDDSIRIRVNLTQSGADSSQLALAGGGFVWGIRPDSMAITVSGSFDSLGGGVTMVFDLGDLSAIDPNAQPGEWKIEFAGTAITTVAGPTIGGAIVGWGVSRSRVVTLTPITK